MADVFSKNIRKINTRAKEKLLESLGKADKTQDEEFEEHLNNFHKQQKGADRLHKELRNYVACVKAMSQASKAFHESVREAYEPEWPGIEHVKAMSQSIELLWDDYHEKMMGQALSPLNSYANQFTDIKGKIGKRGRKLVDYDSARHTYESVSAGNKGANENKVQKVQEQMLGSKKLYEDLNNELLEELPALYDSRITFYVNNMQTVFNLEQTFHAETAKLSRELCVQMDELGHALGRLRVPRKSVEETKPAALKTPPVHPPSPVTQPTHTTPTPTPAKPLQEKQKVSPSSSRATEAVPEHRQNGDATGGGGDGEKRTVVEEAKNPFDSSSDAGSATSDRRASELSADVEVVEKDTVAETEKEKRKASVEEKEKPAPPLPTPTPTETPKEEETHVELNSLEEKLLYKVRATHRYVAEDGDELSFEAGEVIGVIPFDDPDEQDDGWLNGFKPDGSVGVFPANFTKPL